MKKEKEKGVGIFWWILSLGILALGGFWLVSKIKTDSKNEADIIATESDAYVSDPGLYAEIGFNNLLVNWLKVKPGSGITAPMLNN